MKKNKLTLEKIRSNSKLLIFTIFFALLCFVIGDFLNSSSTFFGQQRENFIKKRFLTCPYRCEVVDFDFIKCYPCCTILN